MLNNNTITVQIDTKNENTYVLCLTHKYLTAHFHWLEQAHSIKSGDIKLIRCNNVNYMSISFECNLYR